MDQVFQPGREVAPVTKIELLISCKNLRNRDTFSKSDPFCVLFLQEFGGSRFHEIGRTETIDDTLNPEFARHIPIDYKFEEAQCLRFEVYDSDVNSRDLRRQDFLGRMECTLGEIVGARGAKIQKNLAGLSGGGCGSIIVAADETEASKEVFVMQWRGEKLDKKDFFGKSDPFIQIYRLDDNGSATMIHRTEVIKNTLNPVWKPFRLTSGGMTQGNADRILRFDVYDWDSDGGHDLIGVCEIRVSKLREASTQQCVQFELVNPQLKAKKKGYRNSGVLILASISIEPDYTFLDYVRGGTQLNFTVAIDFTASNGNPADPKSLHYIHPNMPNAYMIALKAVGEICQDYDSDKLFPALGFGARLPPNGQVSHEFFLNFNPSNPHCYRIEGILDAYKRCLMSIQLYGPTNFSPVINHVAKIASSCMDGSNYFVLLIITDGAISDMDHTVASIVNASYLPMSIIIVGVGNADFSAMDFLDADRGALVSQGRRAERDIVQFVPMNRYVTGGGGYATSQAQLAKDVLAEVPLQVTSFMRMRGLKPLPPVQVSLAPEPTGGVEPTTAHGQLASAGAGMGAPQQGQPLADVYAPRQPWASGQQPPPFGTGAPPQQQGQPPSGAYAPQQQWVPPGRQSPAGGLGYQPGAAPYPGMAPGQQPGLYPHVSQQQSAPPYGTQAAAPAGGMAPQGSFPQQPYPGANRPYSQTGGGSPRRSASPYQHGQQPSQRQQPPYSQR